MRSVTGPSLALRNIVLLRPTPDRNDSRSGLTGACKRVACKMPDVCFSVFGDFDSYRVRRREFVQAFCRRFLSPLASDCDLSVEHWLENTSYNQKRKDQIIAALNDIDMGGFTHPGELSGFQLNWVSKSKSFIKEEGYDKFKPSRTINSRSDAFKALVGPLVKQMEHEIFKLASFVKYIPVADRPAYVDERLSGFPSLYVGDFTSFEGSFDAHAMRDLWFEVVHYLISSLPKYYRNLMDVKLKLNRLTNKSYKFQVLAKLLSGEMDTSCSNGVSNLLIVNWVTYCSNFKLFNDHGFRYDPDSYWENPLVTSCVEGDDSISGWLPNVSVPDEREFEAHGFKLKMVPVQSKGDSSFCGMLFNDRSKHILVDPIKAICEFSASSARYHNVKKATLYSLRRCKALSLAHQYPHCPIVRKFADLVLDQTRSYNVKSSIIDGLDSFKKGRALDAIKLGWDGLEKPQITPDDRTKFFDLFGISPKLQQLIEETMVLKDNVLHCPILASLASNDIIGFSESYVDLSGPRKKPFSMSWNTYVDWSCQQSAAAAVSI